MFDILTLNYGIVVRCIVIRWNFRHRGSRGTLGRRPRADRRKCRVR